MKPFAIWLAFIAVVFATGAVASVARDRMWGARQDAWEARAKRAEGIATAELSRADSLVRAADSAAVRATELAKRAQAIGQRVIVRTAQVRALPAPDTCGPFIAARDSIIDQLTVGSAYWETSHRELLSANSTLRESQGRLRLAIDSVASTLAARPLPRSRLLPSITVGPSVGICTSGPCAGITAGLQWRLF